MSSRDEITVATSSQHPTAFALQLPPPPPPPPPPPLPSPLYTPSTVASQISSSSSPRHRTPSSSARLPPSPPPLAARLSGHPTLPHRSNSNRTLRSQSSIHPPLFVRRRFTIPILSLLFAGSLALTIHQWILQDRARLLRNWETHKCTLTDINIQGETQPPHKFRVIAKARGMLDVPGIWTAYDNYKQQYQIPSRAQAEIFKSGLQLAPRAAECYVHKPSGKVEVVSLTAPPSMDATSSAPLAWIATVVCALLGILLFSIISSALGFPIVTSDTREEQRRSERVTIQTGLSAQEADLLCDAFSERDRRKSSFSETMTTTSVSTVGKGGCYEDETHGSEVSMSVTEMETERTEWVCAVCLEDESVESETVRMPCRHRFHYECLRRWLRHGKAACPMCMCDVTNLLGRSQHTD